jgi:hypothetical protein
MNTQTWKQPAWLILLIGIVGHSPLQAQTLLTLPASGTAGSGSTAVDFEFRLDGSIVEKGSGTSTLSNADLDSNSRFIWYPTLSALRAGGNSMETLSEVGQYSAAFGDAVIASGYGSTATGDNSIASGAYSTAMGDSGAGGTLSTAMVQGSAIGAGSVAIGYNAMTYGNFSTAIGNETLANSAYSMALGTNVEATGEYSTATGYYNAANSYNSFVVGTCSAGVSETGTTPTLTSWVSTDPLFEIGNGAPPSGANNYTATLSDAFVVYKNGNTRVQGTLIAHTGLRCPQQGDLSMGSFTAGTAP